MKKHLTSLRAYLNMSSLPTDCASVRFYCPAFSAFFLKGAGDDGADDGRVDDDGDDDTSGGNNNDVAADDFE